MSERRPHWDAHLIDAIGADLRDVYENGYSEDQIFRVIAAVEDWMDANDNPLPHVLNECLQWLDAERAAIQRVREVCEQQAFPLNDVPTMAVTVTQILRALEGEQGRSECNQPSVGRALDGGAE